jgi:serine/threonine-protein kinase
LLSLADVWSNTAQESMKHRDAFYSAELGITPKVVGKISLYHSASGLHCVQALISHAMNDLVSRNEALENFIACSNQLDSPLDISFGRSGILIGCALLYDAMPKAASILEYGDNVLTSICNQITPFKPIAEGDEVKYTGIAHGWAGILYSILRWCYIRKLQLPEGIEERLHQLSACAEPDEIGCGLKWMRLVPSVSKVQGQDYMPGWCNGTAGFVYLWTLAHQFLGDEFYFKLAEKAALNVIEDPDRIANLCCGLGGRSYALLNLYKYSGNSKWLVEAYRLAVLALKDSQRFGFATHSLYKGDLGLALLAKDLRHPELSSMPLFESEGWSY